MDMLIALVVVVVVFMAGRKFADVMSERELHPRQPHHWKWVTALCTRWNKVERYVHGHQKPFHRVHGVLHASYFTMVFTHGPYNVAAGFMLAFIVIGWLLHLEDQ
jgi:hypothetical protein